MSLRGSVGMVAAIALQRSSALSWAQGEVDRLYRVDRLDDGAGNTNRRNAAVDGLGAAGTDFLDSRRLKVHHHSIPMRTAALAIRERSAGFDAIIDDPIGQEIGKPRNV